MRLEKRLMIVCGCLLVGVGVHFAIQWHLAQASEDPFPQIRSDLSVIPLQLNAAKTEWHGEQLSRIKQLREKLPFKDDDMLYRTYVESKTRVPVQVYMVYSREGTDRDHHPEVCIRDVAGAPEDSAFRKIIFLDKDKTRAVQRFRFQTGTDEYTTVYYWHYTIRPKVTGNESALQTLHNVVGKRAPSITVQVSTLGRGRALKEIEQDLLPEFDKILRDKLLPDTARMGCNRMRVTVIWE